MARQTPDRRSHLQAICDRPHDDAPRLKYAEFLEATDVPEDALRGEFIRVQCELAQTDLSSDQWEILDNRKDTLERNQERWGAELPKLNGVRWSTSSFRRGFVWDVWCDDEAAFRANAEAIFISAPIQSVSFRKLKSLRSVVETPLFSRITRLIAEGQRLGSADAQVLAESPNAASLTAVHLSRNRIGDTGAQAIAASPYLKRLDNLDLGHNQIGDDGVKGLADSLVVASLSHLRLAGNPLTDIGALALASSGHLDRLTGFTLWECNRIGKKGKKALRARFGDTVSFVD